MVIKRVFFCCCCLAMVMADGLSLTRQMIKITFIYTQPSPTNYGGASKTTSRVESTGGLDWPAGRGAPMRFC
jgi:hypothetical protein